MYSLISICPFLDVYLVSSTYWRSALIIAKQYRSERSNVNWYSDEVSMELRQQPRKSVWPYQVRVLSAKFWVVFQCNNLGQISNKMIPPNASLVKYDNPVLVSRNTEKKTPRVSNKLIVCRLPKIKSAEIGDKLSLFHDFTHHEQHFDVPIS